MSDEKITYLASPYSHPHPAVREARFRAVSMVAARLIREGRIVFCPIAHSHPIAIYGEVDGGWETWKRQDTAILDRCDEFAIYAIPGWAASTGVSHEREHYEARPGTHPGVELLRATDEEKFVLAEAYNAAGEHNMARALRPDIDWGVPKEPTVGTFDRLVWEAQQELLGGAEKPERDPDDFSFLTVPPDPFGDALAAVFEDAMALQRRKRADYTGGTGPLDNYELAGRTGCRAFGGSATLSEEQYALGGMVARMQEKVTRAANLVLADPTVSDESAEDTWKDMGIIGFLGTALLRLRRERLEQIEAQVADRIAQAYDPLPYNRTGLNAPGD